MTPEELDRVMGWISLVGAPAEQDQTAYVSVNTLNKIREEGYAAIGWGQHNLTPGKTSSIAVPIFRDGRFEASLTLIYFAAAMKQGEAVERYLSDLMTTAEAISGELAASDLADMQDVILLN
jgi:IclR family mhp operon transcriptional activator